MIANNDRRKKTNIIILTTLLLTFIGLVMITSSSAIWAKYLHDDAYYFTKRQVIFIIIGLIMFYICSHMKSNILKKYSKTILIGSFVLLILVLIPGIGQERNGSKSWFGIGPFAVQPAELFKIAIIIYCAEKLDDKYWETKSFFKGVIPIMIPALLGFGLIMMQPDFGTGLVMLMSVVIMTMISKTRMSNYVKLAFLGVVSLAALIISAPYRLKRVTSFINPWQDPLGSGFQSIQSLYAIGPSGILGLGVGESIQKHYFLPEPQTDFIFAIIAEEWGFIGASFVVVLFAILIYCGYSIAINCKEKYHSFLTTGIVSLIGVQTIINLSVVVGLMPVTGITLPFISYGGSSLVVSLIAMGILVSLSRENENENSNMWERNSRSFLSCFRTWKRIRKKRT